MNLEDSIKGLNSKTRREILKLLCKENLSAIEVYRKLKNGGPKYRQSINKALEVLKECGLVEKYYDDEKNEICYRIIKKKICLDLANMELEN